ncbi:MAG: dihydrofolate reductase [Pseudomonadales bacterium]|nr:dihydrofolate reductase [Pseudomonadales bacterium]
MRKAIIAAMAENRTIGINNNLPWYLPEDLKYFKRVTLGKPIIMGRKTFESIGKPLPGRKNIVVTRNPEWQSPGVDAVQDLESAVSRAESAAMIEGTEEVMIIGGDQIYHLALPKVDRLYLTLVHAEVQGDAWFPELDWGEWQEVSRESFSAEGANIYDYSFVVFDRR